MIKIMIIAKDCWTVNDFFSDDNIIIIIIAKYTPIVDFEKIADNNNLALDFSPFGVTLDCLFIEYLLNEGDFEIFDSNGNKVKKSPEGAIFWRLIIKTKRSQTSPF